MEKYKTIIKTTILILIISYVVYNVNYHTTWIFNSFLHHHYGKDNGISRQIQSACILSALFYFVLATSKKILFLLIGFVIGLLSIILSIIIGYRFVDNNLFPHILSCVIFISLFYLLPKRWLYAKTFSGQ